MKRHRQLSPVFTGQLTKVLAELEGVTTGKLSPEEKNRFKIKCSRKFLILTIQK
jgi:hypothetical protein